MGTRLSDWSPAGRESEKRRAGGAKREIVPVPVLNHVQKSYEPVEIRDIVPVRSLLAILKNMTDEF